MIRYIIPLIGSMAAMWPYVLNSIFALAFVASVPCFIRDIFRR